MVVLALMNMATSRTKWSDELIERELREMCSKLGCFPSAQQMRAAGRNDLAMQVSRRGGFVGWSERIGVDRNHSNSDTGWDGEKAILKKLVDAGFQVERPREVKCPYDLLIDSVLRIDVKSTSYAEYGPCSGWFYRIGKHAQADMIILCQLDLNEFYALPWWSCPKTNITISKGGGIYQSFSNRFDLIRAMIDLRKSERLKIA